MLGHLTYLVLEVVWALPVLALQWAAGWKTLWTRRRVLLLSLVVPTAYLSCSDGVAIAQGIWTLHSSRIMGLTLGNVPVEEVVFFLLTNAMVVNSVILIAGRVPHPTRPAAVAWFNPSPAPRASGQPPNSPEARSDRRSDTGPTS